MCLLQDGQLAYKRMDFLKLPSYEGAVDLMQKGYQYAERVAATGEYDQKLGSARRSVTRQEYEGQLGAGTGGRGPDQAECIKCL